DAEAVDEGVVQGLRVRRIGATMVAEVVVLAEVERRLAQRGIHRFRLHAAEAREMCEHRETTSDRGACGRDVRVNDGVDPRSEAQAVGLAATGGCRTTRDLDRAGEAVLVGPNGKDDALGMSRGDLDDAFAGRGDLERYLRHVGCRKPFETARRPVAIDLVA